MLPEDYKALKAMQEEFQKELEKVKAQADGAYRRVRETDALILALTKVEPEDMRVFSPRQGKNYDGEKIEEICREREACEERCRTLEEKKAFLSRHISTLEEVLSRQKVENGEDTGKLEMDKAESQELTAIDTEQGMKLEAGREEWRKPDTEGDEKINSLTEREKEILCQVAEGMLNKEIAASLDISEQTVKNHISNIFQKLDVADRTQAAVFAIKNGLGG